MEFEFTDFNRKHPIFYKMRHEFDDGSEIVLSALDIALENNQIRALNLMISYIIEYQNSFAFYFLFDNIFI